jgi:hypothetical protein
MPLAVPNATFDLAEPMSEEQGDDSIEEGSAEHRALLIEGLHAELEQNDGSSARWIVIVLGVLVFAGFAAMIATALLS